MKGALVAALLLAAGNAQAGALAECAAAARAPADVMARSRVAQRQATRQLFDAFLTIEQALGERQSDAAREQSSAALGLLAADRSN